MARWTASALAAVLALAAATAFATPTEEEIARLAGPELTPVGAERASNAEGTIPEWTGGVTEPPPGWEPGMKRPDLFAGNPILFTIDASNEFPTAVSNSSVCYDLVADRYVLTPAFNAEKEPVYEHLGTEARTIADDKGLFTPDDLRRMGKR